LDLSETSPKVGIQCEQSSGSALEVEHDAVLLYPIGNPADGFEPVTCPERAIGLLKTYNQDQFFPPSQVAGLTEELTAAGVEHDFHYYLAHHAFGNEQAVGEGRIEETHYDPVWAHGWGIRSCNCTKK
jgi:dienelactone hydrolase